MENKLPIYELLVDETDNETGTQAISLVKHPAVEQAFLKFNEVKQVKFQVTNQQEQILTGVVAIPDMLISRGDHFVYFSKDTIKKMAMKFAKDHNLNKVNTEHLAETFTKDCYVFESWLTGNVDKANELGFNVPSNSWMVSMKVNNTDLWNKAMSGDFTGFSLEGMFYHTPVENQSPEEDLVKKILNILKNI